MTQFIAIDFSPVAHILWQAKLSHLAKSNGAFREQMLPSDLFTGARLSHVIFFPFGIFVFHAFSSSSHYSLEHGWNISISKQRRSLQIIVRVHLCISCMWMCAHQRLSLSLHMCEAAELLDKDKHFKKNSCSNVQWHRFFTQKQRCYLWDSLQRRTNETGGGSALVSQRRIKWGEKGTKPST